MLDVIEKKIETAEKYISSGAISKLDKNISKKLESDLIAYSMIQTISEEQMNLFQDRIKQIGEKVEEYQNTISSQPKRYLKVPNNTLSTIKTNARKNLFAAGMVAALGITLVACAGKKEPEAVETTDQMVEAPVELEPEIELEQDIEVKEPTEMSEEIKAFSDKTVESIDNALVSGINLSLTDELTEADKETYAKTLTQYRIVANMDDLTNLEYAELFGELVNPTEDLISGYNFYNTKIWEHLLVVTGDNKLDYRSLYNNEKDAEVLNKSEDLIAHINDAKNSNERLEVAKEWYSYVVSILTDEKGGNVLTPQAMDTLIIHSSAYDELTRSYYNDPGTYIDDELEHRFTAAKNSCLDLLNESNLDVEDMTISDLRGEFMTSMKNKLQAKYEDALAERTLQLTLKNPLNKFNSFSEVVDYVKEKIDLTKYVKIEIDHIEKQQQEKGVNAPAQKSRNDSGVSDGNGGNISTQELVQHGVNPDSPTAKQEYEQSVVDQTDQESEASKTVTDENGKELEGTVEDNQQGFQDGYSDGNSGKPYTAPSGNKSYNEGYNKGYEKGKQDLEAVMNANSETESEYIPEDNGEITTTESTETVEDYTTEQTEQNTTDDNTETIFIPVNEETKKSEGSVRQVSDFSVQSELETLRAMRDTLLSTVSLEEKSSKTL